MTSRASIFGARPELDVKGFAPKSGEAHRPDPSAIDEVRSNRFRSREPAQGETSPSPSQVGHQSANGILEVNPAERLSLSAEPTIIGDHSVLEQPAQDQQSTSRNQKAFGLPKVNQAETLSQAPAPVRRQERRSPMTYRTGRNTTVSIKTTNETVEDFYAIAQEQGWKVSQTFEEAIKLLRSKVGSRPS